jgi:hypothetical protein
MMNLSFELHCDRLGTSAMLLVPTGEPPAADG